MIKITSSLISKGRKNRPGIANPKLYVTVHNTGNTSKDSGAKNHASYVKSDAANNIPVSWHYTVDDNSIYQHIPEDEVAYHAGDGKGKGNMQSIGVEICMNSDGNILQATNNAVELIADICKRNGIPFSNIKQHYHWSKKNCPLLLRNNIPYDWKTFVDKIMWHFSSDNIDKPPVEEMYRVRQSWEQPSTQKGAYTNLENAKAKADKLNSEPNYFVYDSRGNIVYPE